MRLNGDRNVRLVFHMLGLGDHIVFNGMVRRLLVQHSLEGIYVLAWDQYASQVSYMFRDDTRIQVISIQSGNEYIHSRHVIKQVDPNYLYLLGHTILPGQPFEDLVKPHTKYYQASWKEISEKYPHGNEGYYLFSEVDWHNRYTSYYCQRDMQEESRLFDKLNPNHEEFVFIQDDFRRGFTFNEEKVLELVGKDVKIINNDTSENIFHYGLLLQNAKQIHLMESSFRCFVETIPTENVEFYLHHYIRNTERLVYNGKICPVESRKNWKVIL